MFNIDTHSKSTKTDEMFVQIASGFRMKFENGNTISVQFGCGNYCDNKRESQDNCKNAEIAIWHENGTDYWFDNEPNKIAIGWQTADEVAKWITFAQSTII